LQNSEPQLPFLKWPGGKRWAASRIAALIHQRLKRKYFEPFLGGGAMFFHLRPQRALLSDINSDLVNTYIAVRDNCPDVLKALKRLRVTKSEYYRIREWEPCDHVCRAARFLYLNRTAFGGMYRLSLTGKFNVPYGGGQRTPEVLWERGLLAAAESTLQAAQIRTMDFEEAIDMARPGDVIYCDPTYTVAHDKNGFIRYNERNFSWEDQERLAKACRRARRRGSTVIVSNAHHDMIKKLYPKAAFTTLERASCISTDAQNRRIVHEYLILL
jgi:DNA adenine methylase